MLFRSEKDKLESVLANIDDGVIALDRHMKVLFFNKAVEDIMKLKLDAGTGHEIDTLATFNTNKTAILLSDIVKNAKEHDKPATLSFHTAEKHDGKIRLSVTKINTTDENDIAYLCTIQDISKEEMLEEMKLDFVSMAAHELRTPLTSIKGYLTLVNDQ